MNHRANARERCELFVRRLRGRGVGRFGVTTIEAGDERSGGMVQAALPRGEDELVFWGARSNHRRGDVIALYVPKNRAFRPEERRRIRHIYVAAADAADMRGIADFPWDYAIPMYRRVTLAVPLDLDLMCETIGSARRNFRGPHSRSGEKTFDSFWTLVCDTNPEMVDRMELRLLGPDRDDVAISYASEDLGFVQQIARQCIEDRRWATFYSMAPGPTPGHGIDVLLSLLAGVYRASQTVVVVLSRFYISKEWPLVELASAIDHPNLVVLRVDDTRLTDVRVQAVGGREVPDLSAVASRLTAASLCRRSAEVPTIDVGLDSRDAIGRVMDELSGVLGE